MKESEAPLGNINDRYVLSKQNGNTQLGRYPEQKSSPCTGRFGAGRRAQEVGGDGRAGSRGYGNTMGILPLGCEIIAPVLSSRMLSETWQSPAQAGSRYSDVSEERVTQHTAITS